MVNARRVGGRGLVGTGALVLALAAALMVAPHGLAAQSGPQVKGTWALALEGAFASESWALEVAGEGEALTATLVMGGMGRAPLQDVALKGDTLSGHFTANMHGQEMHVVVTTAIEGDACKGAVTGFPMGDVPFTGHREKS